MTELAELRNRLLDFAVHLEPTGDTYADEIGDLREAAAAIERLERERADWEAACDGNTALGAEIAETLKAALEAAESRALTAEAELEKVREALTPSGGTKAAYMGEFHIAVERIVNEDGEPEDDAEGAPDPYDHIQVPWTTVKEIMAAIRARALSEERK